MTSQSAGIPSDSSGIAIVGNMNTGKTTLFNQLCNARSESINYPGTTVSIAKGRMRGFDKAIFDTPGASSIFAQNEDERISVDILLSIGIREKIEGIILVADAKKLKRAVALAIQYGEYGVPMLFDINMIDEAQAHGIAIDPGQLAEELGMDVCESVATDGIGISEIRSKLCSLKRPKRLLEYPRVVEEFIEIVEKLLFQEGEKPARGIPLLLLVGNKGMEDCVGRRYGLGMLEQIRGLAEEYRRKTKPSLDFVLSNLYNQKAEEIVHRVQRVSPPLRSPLIDKLGRSCMQYGTGIPIACAVMGLMYLFVGVFGAGFLVDTINGTLFKGLLIPWFTAIVEPIPSPLIRDVIVDADFGLLPTGLFLALGLVLPVLFCFYLFFGFLEDSGYLARLSVLFEKVLDGIGLNGKAVMPLAMGFSCITMAILSARALDSKKQKNIASFLLLLGIPCAPLLSVMFILLKKMPLSATITVFGLIGGQILMAGYLASRLFTGSRVPLLIEIPNMRIPNLYRVAKRSAVRTYFFMKEAVPVFIVASLVVFSFHRIGGLALIESIFRPVIQGFIGLPEKSIQVFIKTLIRRESGAAELARISSDYNNLQLVVNLFMMAFMVPCINAAIVLIKERGVKIAATMILAVIVYAAFIGGIVSNVCRLCGFSFT